MIFAGHLPVSRHRQFNPVFPAASRSVEPLRFRKGGSGNRELPIVANPGRGVTLGELQGGGCAGRGLFRFACDVQSVGLRSLRCPNFARAAQKLGMQLPKALILLPSLKKMTCALKNHFKVCKVLHIIQIVRFQWKLKKAAFRLIRSDSCF